MRTTEAAQQKWFDNEIILKGRRKGKNQGNYREDSAIH